MLFPGRDPVSPPLSLTPADLYTLLWCDPGSVIHGLEEIPLQLQEILVQVLPGVSAQQELEDAPLGYGVVFLHVTGDVTATGTGKCTFLTVTVGLRQNWWEHMVRERG